jgi:hypothetical protein
VGGIEIAGCGGDAVAVATAVGVGHAEPSARTHFVGVDTQADVRVAVARIGQQRFMPVFSMQTAPESRSGAWGERGAVDNLIRRAQKLLDGSFVQNAFPTSGAVIPRIIGFHRRTQGRVGSAKVSEGPIQHIDGHRCPTVTRFRLPGGRFDNNQCRGGPWTRAGARTDHGRPLIESP